MTQNNRKQDLKNLGEIAAFTGLALLFFYVESFIPPLIPIIPFAKIGLANCVTLLALMVLGVRKSFVVLLARCLIGSLFMGNVFALVYSLSAGIVSFIFTAFCFKFLKKVINIFLISVLAAIIHNIVQVFVAYLIVGNFYIAAILPYLLIISVVSGIITAGLAVYLKKTVYEKKEKI